MNTFKVGDIVAPVTNPWNGKFLVTKISGGKAKVKAWEDWGLIGRFFPLRTYTIPVMFLCVPQHEPQLRAGCTSEPVMKPPVNDPETDPSKDRPL